MRRKRTPWGEKVERATFSLKAAADAFRRKATGKGGSRSSAQERGSRGEGTLSGQLETDKGKTQCEKKKERNVSYGSARETGKRFRGRMRKGGRCTGSDQKNRRQLIMVQQREILWGE